jgi:hypothetical protein
MTFHFEPVRTTHREVTGARGRALPAIILVCGMAMLLATSCTHGTNSPPSSPSQSPGQKGGGGGW